LNSALDHVLWVGGVKGAWKSMGSDRASYVTDSTWSASDGTVPIIV
jgi:hypothetical protein